MPDTPSFQNHDATLRNVRLPDAEGPYDVIIENGLVSDIVAYDPLAFRPGTGIDGRGNLALPAFVDGHVHLDKTYLGVDWVSHVGDDSVRARIDLEKALRETHRPSLYHRATTLARQMLAHGTTGLRSHIDIDEVCRLKSLETILMLRQDMQDLLDIQLVAFPQSGSILSPTVLQDLETALRLGADVLGALDPSSIDGNPEASLNATFDLASRLGVGIDMHLHEAGETGARVIENVCRRVSALGMKGHVVISHGFCLADLAQDRLAQLGDQMSEAGVALMTSAPGPGPLVPITALIERGVQVFCGSDNIRDPWAPFGNGDMLDRAHLLAYRGDLRTDDGLALAFDCATRFPAEVLGFSPRGPQIGAQADIVLLPSPSVQRAVCDIPASRQVIRKGREVAL